MVCPTLDHNWFVLNCTYISSSMASIDHWGWQTFPNPRTHQGARLKNQCSGWSHCATQRRQCSSESLSWDSGRRWSGSPRSYWQCKCLCLAWLWLDLSTANGRCLQTSMPYPAWSSLQKILRQWAPHNPRTIWTDLCDAMSQSNLRHLISLGNVFLWALLDDTCAMVYDGRDTMWDDVTGWEWGCT